MVDTGSTYTYLPVEYADKLFRTLGMKTTTIEIFKLKTLVAYMACDGPIPPLKVKLGTIQIAFTMSRQSLLIKSNQPGICFLKIVGHDVHDSNTIHAIIGNQFLMSEWMTVTATGCCTCSPSFCLSPHHPYRCPSGVR